MPDKREARSKHAKQLKDTTQMEQHGESLTFAQQGSATPPATALSFRHPFSLRFPAVDLFASFVLHTQLKRYTFSSDPPDFQPPPLQRTIVPSKHSRIFPASADVFFCASAGSSS
jgi:hypothetical protein